MEQGRTIKAASQSLSAIGTGIDAGLHHLAATPAHRAMTRRSEHGDRLGALKACKQATSILGRYDHDHKLGWHCQGLQEMVGNQ